MGVLGTWTPGFLFLSLGKGKWMPDWNRFSGNFCPALGGLLQTKLAILPAAKIRPFSKCLGAGILPWI